MIVVLGTGHCAEVTETYLKRLGHDAMNYELTVKLPIDVLWCCSATTDTALLTKILDSAIQFVRKEGLVILATPVPVGTCRRFQQRWPEYTWISAPENLRRGDDVAAMLNQTHVIGTVDGKENRRASELFNWQVICTDFESAEMKKLALNTFLAMQIEFANEVARICESVCANYEDVEKGLRSDPRIGEYAYLRAGEADTTHLMRDVKRLLDLGADLPSFPC